MTYNFEKFVSPRRKPILRGIEVGEIRFFEMERGEVALAITRRMRAYPLESYSWATLVMTIAVRRDT